jgi:hypothetical protein
MKLSLKEARIIYNELYKVQLKLIRNSCNVNASKINRDYLVDVMDLRLKLDRFLTADIIKKHNEKM